MQKTLNEEEKKNNYMQLDTNKLKKIKEQSLLLLLTCFFVFVNDILRCFYLNYHCFAKKKKLI